MILNDKIWGSFKIEEPVLVELINSKPIQRLKKISQAGASKYIIPWKTVSRFDHSIGAMLLLRKFNANLEEQIAGLLHDVSHTIFSHVIDFVFPSDKHEFHDEHFEKLILQSRIPEILNRHNLTLKKILDVHNFPLLENTLPDICADRIDYFIRDEESQLGINKVILETRNNLIVFRNSFVFADAKAAYDFSLGYLKRDETTWSEPREIAVYMVLAQAIKKALENKILTEEDLFTEDDLVFNKLKSSKDKYIQKRLNLINYDFQVKSNNQNYDFHLKNKLRYVDPYILFAKNNLKRVSQIYPQYRKKLQAHNEKMRKGFYVTVKGL